MIIILIISVATTPFWITFFGHLIVSFLKYYFIFAIILAFIIVFCDKTGLIQEINQVSAELGIPSGAIIILTAFIATLKLTARKK